MQLQESAYPTRPFPDYGSIVLRRQAVLGRPAGCVHYPNYLNNHRSELVMKPSALRQTRLTPKLHLWSLTPASVSFENLPSEIWHEVCAVLDRKSLAAARRVCHRLADIAAHHLFQDLYVNWLPNSIDRLSAVASHPELSRHVRSLAFEQKLLRQNLTNFDDFESCVDISLLRDTQMSGDVQKDPDRIQMNQEIDHWDGSFQDEARRRMHAMLSRVLIGQGTILADAGGLGIRSPVNLTQDEVLGSMREMVSRLVEGQSVVRCVHDVVSKLVKDQRALLANPGMPGLLGHLSFSLPNLYTLRMTPYVFGEWTDYDDGNLHTEAFDRSNAARESLQDGLLLSDAFEHDEGPIKLVLDALATAPTRIKTLQVYAVPAYFWMGGGEPWTYESNLGRKKEKGFLTLRSLDIRFVMIRGNNAMARFLQHFAKVTYMNLHIYARPTTELETDSSCVRSLWSDYPLGDISEVLKPLHLGQLRALVIDRFSIAEEAFVIFMKAHSETLRSITFKIPYMVSSAHQPIWVSSWEKAITEVAPFMSLRHADLGELQDSALSHLFRQTSHLGSHLGGCYCHERDRRIRNFRSSVTAYLLSGGQARYPTYEPLTRRDVSCTNGVKLLDAAAA